MYNMAKNSFLAEVTPDQWNMDKPEHLPTGVIVQLPVSKYIKQRAMASYSSWAIFLQ